MPLQVVVYSKHFKREHLNCVQELFDVLTENNIQTYVYTPFMTEINNFIDFKQPIHPFIGYQDFSRVKIDCVITLGGDGTILGAATEIRDSGVPIMGINLGRLGFLASIEKKHIRRAISDFAKGMFFLEERSMLHLETNLPLFDDVRFALNDFTLLKRDTSSMVTIHTYINGAYLNTYWADGIIVATPTGSTGYSLSCGGPIIFPRSGNFVITPVAPHNLNVRPVVISDNSVISFEIEGRAENFLCTLDSRYETITSDHQLAVRKEDFFVNLIRLNDSSFMSTIREKLTWGIDRRN